MKSEIDHLLWSDNPKDLVRGLTAIGLATTLDRRYIKRISELSGDKDIGVRSAALLAVEQLWVDVPASTLLEGVSYHSPIVRLATCRYIGLRFKGAESIVSKLFTVANDKDSDVAEAAHEALRKVGVKNAATGSKPIERTNRFSE